MFNIGPLELLVILIVVLIVFGPNRLPEVARALGKAVNEFKKVTNSAQQALNEVSKEITDAESEKKETVEATPSRPEDFLKAVQQEEAAAQKTAEAADLKGETHPEEKSAG